MAKGGVIAVGEGRAVRFRLVGAKCQAGASEVPWHGAERADDGATVPPPFRGGTGGTRHPPDALDTDTPPPVAPPSNGATDLQTAEEVTLLVAPTPYFGHEDPAGEAGGGGPTPW